MLFKLKCRFARMYGKLLGLVCGFICGRELARYGFNKDTALYVFNNIQNKELNRMYSKYDDCPDITLTCLIKEGFITHRRICRKVHEYAVLTVLP